MQKGKNKQPFKYSIGLEKKDQSQIIKNLFKNLKYKTGKNYCFILVDALKYYYDFILGGGKNDV